MVEVSSLVLILLAEAVGVLTLVVLVMAFLGWRRRSEDKKAIKALIAGVNERSDARQQALLDFLRPRCGDEGAEAALGSIMEAETGFYQAFIRLYRKRDPDLVAALHESLDAMTAPYRELDSSPEQPAVTDEAAADPVPEGDDETEADDITGEAVDNDDIEPPPAEAPEAQPETEPEAEAEAELVSEDEDVDTEEETPEPQAEAQAEPEPEGGPEAPELEASAQPPAEDGATSLQRMEELTNENARLAHELEITRSTLNNMLDEYASVLTESNAGEDTPGEDVEPTPVAGSADAHATPSVEDELDALAASATEAGQDILDELDLVDNSDISLVDVDISDEEETQSSSKVMDPGATASVSLDELDIELAGTDDLTDVDEDLAQAS